MLMRDVILEGDHNVTYRRCITDLCTSNLCNTFKFSCYMFLERGREGDEGERHPCARETQVYCL